MEKNQEALKNELNLLKYFACLELLSVRIYSFSLEIYE